MGAVRAKALLERAAVEVALTGQKKEQKELASAEGRVAMAEYERAAQEAIKRTPALQKRGMHSRGQPPRHRNSRKK